jgi:hypothetical protein
MLGTPYERLMSVDPPERDDRSYADLVHEVLRSAAAPLTFDEIFARVNAIRSVRTRDPWLRFEGRCRKVRSWCQWAMAGTATCHT